MTTDDDWGAREAMLAHVRGEITLDEARRRAATWYRERSGKERTDVQSESFAYAVDHVADLGELADRESAIKVLAAAFLAGHNWGTAYPGGGA